MQVWLLGNWDGLLLFISRNNDTSNTPEMDLDGFTYTTLPKVFTRLLSQAYEPPFAPITAECMLRYLILFTCCHGSDQNTWKWFGFGSEHFCLQSNIHFHLHLASGPGFHFSLWLPFYSHISREQLITTLNSFLLSLLFPFWNNIYLIFNSWISFSLSSVAGRELT